MGGVDMALAMGSRAERPPMRIPRHLKMAAAARDGGRAGGASLTRGWCWHCAGAVWGGWGDLPVAATALYADAPCLLACSSLCCVNRMALLLVYV